MNGDKGFKQQQHVPVFQYFGGDTIIEVVIAGSKTDKVEHLNGGECKGRKLDPYLFPS